MGDARIIKPHEKIRQAVQFKGSRYGTMTVPYLIVVADCKDELRAGHIGDAALEAMFGTIVTNVWKDKNGKTVMKDGRATDGYWDTADARRHRDVSGILILPKPHLWDLRDERWQPILLRNPWAERPLPDDLLPLPGAGSCRAKGRREACGLARLAACVAARGNLDEKTEDARHVITRASPESAEVWAAILKHLETQ
jgi:hypothetical protein